MVDFELLDERLIQEDALAKIRVLVMAGADVLEASTLDKITSWVSAGGLLFVLDSRPQDWDGPNNSFDAFLGFAPGSDEIRGITEVAVDKVERLPSLASLPPVFVSRAFTGLAADVEPYLSMRYAEEGRVAWRRRVGEGYIYVYFGPMDLKQREDSWMVSYNIPFRFLRDGIEDCARLGFLKKAPLSLNFNVSGVYLVETAEGLLALNMSDETKTVKTDSGGSEIPGRALLKIK